MQTLRTELLSLQIENGGNHAEGTGIGNRIGDSQAE